MPLHILLSISIYFGCQMDKTQETNSDFDLSTIVICAKGGGYQSWYHVPGGPNETAPSATLCPANGIGVLGWF